MGPSLTRKHRYVSTQNLAVGSDYYILLAPVPGIACFNAVVTAGAGVVGTTVFTAVPYTDFPSMFGTSTTQSADIVTKFRFVSNHIEVIPTVNQMTWSGQISAWKIPLSLVTRQGGSSTSDLLTVEGLKGCNTTLANQYTSPFINGMYAGCYSSNPTFSFSQIIEYCVQLPSVIGPGIDFGALNNTTGLPGLDNNFETLCIKISGITANESYILKTWACVEYQVSADSVLYEFQSLSPCDPIALKLYREIINDLPIGVPFIDNDSFWSRVLSIINSLSGVGAHLPGAYGGVSRGVNLISGAMLPFFK